MTWGKRGQITDVKIGVWCYDGVQACASLVGIKATFVTESQQGRARARADWQNRERGGSWQATGPFG